MVISNLLMTLKGIDAIDYTIFRELGIAVNLHALMEGRHSRCISAKAVECFGASLSADDFIADAF